jgi:Zn-dependent M28 family amino/carboxypeptidase
MDFLLMFTFSSVRAVVNLEGALILFNVDTTHTDSNGLAAGTTGRELLFQATSQEMIEAYSHVPRCVARCEVHSLY